MAYRDVKRYYSTMLGQYLALKDDLKDFEQGFKDGYITEDRLEEVKEELARVKENSDRIAYIMFLFELPNRKEKQAKHKKSYADVMAYLKEIKADTESITEENKCITAQIKQQLKELIKEDKQ